MPSVLFLKPFVYAGRKVPAGTLRDLASVSDYRLLKTLKIIDDAPAASTPQVPPSPAPPVDPVPDPEPIAVQAASADDSLNSEEIAEEVAPDYGVRDMTAESNEPLDTPKRKRAYKRRDMRAEGE